MTSTLTMDDILRRAKSLVRTEPSREVAKVVRRYADAFDAKHVSRSDCDLNLFTFHVGVPDSHRRIDYVDVKHDHHSFDYPKLISHFFSATRMFNKRVQSYFITDDIGDAPQASDDVVTVRLETDKREPMFERVKAMAGYVESKAFDRDTAFLDTDAFPNRALAKVFSGEFDVGVTFRPTAGYMPLNEGVIFGSRANKDAVRRFFSAYVATYEALITDDVIIDYYGDVKRWRGGQLSLSALAYAPPAGPLKTHTVAGDVRVRVFPCNTHNYWVTKHIPPGARTLDRKFVLHLKGDSKQFIGDIIAYQASRAKA